MILTFSRPEFETLIKNGVKIHTIREDKHNRWKVGMKIHFWSGNPRNIRSKKKPYCFGVGEVAKIREVTIHPLFVTMTNPLNLLGSGLFLDDFARQDGFKNYEAMIIFFNRECFEGKIIYWKNCTWY